jgi:hypothetical protein
MTLPEGTPGVTNGITWVNWRNHPWQMWGLSSILVWAFGVLIDNNAYFHLIPLTDINNPKTLNLIAAAVFVGALISLTGLHMKDREFGIWAEVSGYVVLIGTLGVYFGMVVYYYGPAASLSRVGTATTVGYILAMIQRTFQIVAYQASRAKVTKIEYEIIQAVRHENDAE